MRPLPAVLGLALLAACQPAAGPAEAPAPTDPLAARAAALDAAIDDPGIRVSAADGRLVVVLQEASIFLRGEPVWLLEEGEATLATVAAGLKGLGGGVQVIGHTDDTGSPAYAQDLSERQAQTVAEALEAGGVSPRRVRSWGVGDQSPRAPNDSPRNRSLNRWVEIIATPAG